MPATLDTLETAKRLRGAGFTEAQAEAVTGALREAHEADLSQLATKADLQAVRADLQAVKGDLQAEMGRLELTVKAEIAAIRSEMEILRRDLTIRLGGMIVVATGVLLAAKFFGGA